MVVACTVGEIGNGDGGATTAATSCPKAAPMLTPLAMGDGDCSKSSCHGSAMPITLAE